MTKKTSSNEAGIIQATDSHRSADAVKPMRADARRNRDQVLKVANMVFASEGFAVQIDEIASRAGVGVGTIYRHFPTKEALFEAVIYDHKQRLVEEAKSLFNHEDPGKAFFGFLTHVLDGAITNKALTDDLAGIGYSFDCETSEITQELHQAWSTLLERAQHSGWVRSDIHIAELQALVSGVLHAKNLFGNDVNLPRRIMNVIFDGLRGDRPPK